MHSGLWTNAPTQIHAQLNFASKVNVLCRLYNENVAQTKQVICLCLQKLEIQSFRQFKAPWNQIWYVESGLLVFVGIPWTAILNICHYLWVAMYTHGQSNCSYTKHLPIYWAFRSLFRINSGKNDNKQNQQNRAYAWKILRYWILSSP